MSWAPSARVLNIARRRIPDAADAAEAALRQTLAPVFASSWPAVAWQFSRLNGDGYPVEFTFSSAGPDVRFTAEVAGPERNDALRLEDGVALLSGQAPSEDVNVLRSVQSGASLTFGTWFGARFCGRTSRRKIYVEVPPDRCDAAAALLSRHFADGCVLDGLPVLRFIALTAGEAALECYYRHNHLQSADAGRLLRRCGLSARYNEVMAAIEEATCRATDAVVVPTDAGFSIAVNEAGVRALSIFTFARSIWGSDGHIRRQLLSLADRGGWDFKLYEETSEPLADFSTFETLHGVLAWIVVPDQEVEWRISLRPPAVPD